MTKDLGSILTKLSTVIESTSTCLCAINVRENNTTSEIMQVTKHDNVTCEE